MPQPRRFKPLDGPLVHARYGIFVRHQPGAIARATLQYFAPQPRILVHIQHVHAGVRDPGRDENLERMLPGIEGLPGQACDQIHVEVGDAGRAQSLEVRLNHGAAVQPAARVRLAVDKRLHAQAYAIHARGHQRLQGCIRQLPRRALHGDFGIRVEIELPAQAQE